MYYRSYNRKETKRSCTKLTFPDVYGDSEQLASSPGLLVQGRLSADAGFPQERVLKSSMGLRVGETE